MKDPRFLARPTEAQYEWQDFELGMFFHWMPLSFLGYEKDRLTDPEHRLELAGKITAEGFSAKQYVQSALELGAKYIVFVAKHDLGFRRWRSAYGDFHMGKTQYPGDPVGELAEECRRHGIKLGLYLAPTDFTYGSEYSGGKTKDPAMQEEYRKQYRLWLTELLSNYGEVCEIWLDGSCIFELGDIIKKYAPNAMVFQSKYATIRWVGQEEGYASDPAWNSVNRYDAITGVSTQMHGNPDGEVWLPLECDARLRDSWGYQEENNPLKSVDELMTLYYRSVGHGANLLLNHAPHPDGHILEEDMRRMKEFGDEIRRRFEKPIAQTEGEGEIVELDLGEKQPVDHVIVMEQIAFGERIRSYYIEGFDGETWFRLAAGTAVGHKKIDFFPARDVQKVRIRVAGSVGTPLIRRMAAFHVGSIPSFGQLSFGEERVGGFGIEMYDLQTRQAHLKYDLTHFIQDAGQYRITFRQYDGEGRLKLDAVWADFNGVRQDSYICETDEENVFILTVGGLADIVLHAQSRDTQWKPFSGDVIIQRVN